MLYGNASGACWVRRKSPWWEEGRTSPSQPMRGRETRSKVTSDSALSSPNCGWTNNNILLILDLSHAISLKQCKIGTKLVLITNKKSYMSFRLVPNSVTLDDLQRRNSPNRSESSPNSVAFGTDYVNVVEDTPICWKLDKQRKRVSRFSITCRRGLLTPTGNGKIGLDVWSCPKDR